MRARRGGPPQEHLETPAEGEQVGRYSRWVGTIARHKPADRSLTAWIPEAREAWNALAREFPWRAEQAFEAALAGRRPEQTPAQAAGEFVRFHRELREAGLPAEAALALQERLRGTEGGARVVEALRRARVPGPAMAGVLEAAGAGRRPGEPLVEAVRRVSDDYYLTGEIDGMAAARERVSAAAARGELAGSVGDLLERFEAGVRLGRLAGRDPKEAVARAFEDLRPGAEAGSIRHDGGLVSIGGVLLPVRHA